MSEKLEQDLEDLLTREGHGDVDALMDWARERAESLTPQLASDEELGPLLEAGGHAGNAPEPSPQVERPPIATTRHEPSNAAPLPPIPVTTPATPTDELELDEIEELDVDELELLEDDDDDQDEQGDDAPDDLGDAAEQQPPQDDAPASVDDADTNVGPPPTPPSPAPSAEEAPSYGPPDGNDVVPEWKAALLSTQTDNDAEAAVRIKEASSAEPLPTAPDPDPPSMPLSGRLEAEEDEISQHSLDLSDLDTDDE